MQVAFKSGCYESNAALDKFRFKRGPAEELVLSHCANSQCSRPFLRLRQGKLFLVETESVANPGEGTVAPSPTTRPRARQVERYWLCNECAGVWTLVHDRHRGIVLVPLPRATIGARGAMEEYRETA